MGKKTLPGLVGRMRHLRAQVEASRDGNRSLIPPNPELREKLHKELAKMRKGATGLLSTSLTVQERNSVGMNDGLIFPGDTFPLGTPARIVRSAAADRAPLRGTIRVVVVLVDFSDKPMTQTAQHFNDLFFSTSVLPNGSVREYYREATNNLVDIVGEVAGPFRLPKKLSEYAHGASGTGGTYPNARTMAYDAVVAANPSVNFGPYDNDGNGFVDAFIVVHAGQGAEVTGSTGDIWSHKWVLPGTAAYNADGTKIYAYLTVPEDSKIGVCAHELGHLLFGFPDLYDTDYSSEGIGNWCLMAGGSWNGGGDVPAHPSAWCKVNQGWASVINQTTNADVSIPDVKTSHSVYRLWKDGASGSEYFLVENRQKTLFDRNLPGGGLLIWHIDDSVAGNSNEAHPKVALVQADGKKDLEGGSNRGDAGDPYPGSSANKTFDKGSTPSSKSYASADTCVGVTNIGAAGAVMTAHLSVRCLVKKREKEIRKEVLSEKSLLKDRKDALKERKEFKEIKEKEFKEIKEKEIKERKEFKEIDKPAKEIDKRKDSEKLADRPGGGGFGRSAWEGEEAPQSGLEARLDALEARLAALEPFIDETLRPDMSQSALSEEELGELDSRMREGAAEAKRQFDTKVRER